MLSSEHEGPTEVGDGWWMKLDELSGAYYFAHPERQISQWTRPDEAQTDAARERDLRALFRPLFFTQHLPNDAARPSFRRRRRRRAPAPPVPVTKKKTPLSSFRKRSSLLMAASLLASHDRACSS